MGQTCLSPNNSIQEQIAPKNQAILNADIQITESKQGNEVEVINLKSENKGDHRYKNLLFFWIDPRITSYSNQQNFLTFKSKLPNINGVSSISSLKCEVQETSDNDLIVLISASSLQDKDFTNYMNKQNKISNIVLFCMSEQRANLLKNNNSEKISGVGFTVWEVLLELAKIQDQYVNKGVIKDQNRINLKV